jgi:hypothetical protein
MLFDLQGKRKNFIRVIYAGLALLIGGGLVLFGIGGSGNGGLFDALGIGDGSSTGDISYEKELDSANSALDANPKDEGALLKLTQFEFLTGQAQRETGDNGASRPTGDTVESYNRAADAWERYLALDPKKPDADIARLMVQAYPVVYATAEPAQQEDTLKNLVASAQIVADDSPGLGPFVDLATFAFYAGDNKLGAQAEKKALAAAPDSTTKQQVKQSLAQVRKQAALAAKQAKQQEQASAGAEGTGSLPDPTAGLGAAPGTAPAPTAP